MTIPPTEPPQDPSDTAPDTTFRLTFRPAQLSVDTAMKMIATALVLIVIGIGVILIFGGTERPGSGEATTSGRVVDLTYREITNRNGVRVEECSPTANYVVGGHSHMAGSNIAASPCGWHTGDAVTVIYSASSPDVARIADKPNWIWILWFVPGFGVLMIAWAVGVILRQGDGIRGGLELVGDGLRPTKRETSGTHSFARHLDDT